MPKILGELQSAALENLSADPSSSVSGRVWNNTTENRIKTDDGTLKRAILKNDQHAVIGNSGSPGANIRFHRGANGLIQFLQDNDSTAEGTLSASLNSYSGKVETYVFGSLPAPGNQGRLVYVSDITSFAFDNGGSWDYIRMHRPQIAQASKFSTFGTPGTPAIGDGVRYCDSSGGAFALTLPTAVGNDGEELVFKKTSNDFAVVTLTGITTLNTNGESVKLVSNNTTWVIEDRYIPGEWHDAGATVITGTSTAPSKGTTTTDKMYWRRDGSTMIVRIQYKQTSAGAVIAAGAHLINIPSGAVIDSSLVANDIQATATVGGVSVTNTVGSMWIVAQGSGNYIQGNVISYSSAAVAVQGVYYGNGAASTTQYWGSTFNSFSSGVLSFNGTFQVPISGWNG